MALQYLEIHYYDNSLGAEVYVYRSDIDGQRYYMDSDAYDGQAEGGNGGGPGQEVPGSLFGLVNAETGDKTQLDSTVENSGNTIAVLGDAALHGDYGFRILYGGSAGLCYGVKTFTAQNEEWFRFYIKIPTTLTIPNYASLFFFSLYDGAIPVGKVGAQLFGNERWALQYRYDTTVYSATNFSKDEMHYIDIGYFRHATTGGIEVWVDDTQILVDRDQDTTGYEVDTIWVGDVDGNDVPDSGDYFDIDDLIGDDNRVGEYVAVENASTLAIGNAGKLNGGNAGALNNGSGGGLLSGSAGGL